MGSWQFATRRSKARHLKQRPVNRLKKASRPASSVRLGFGMGDVASQSGETSHCRRRPVFPLHHSDESGALCIALTLDASPISWSTHCLPCFPAGDGTAGHTMMDLRWADATASPQAPEQVMAGSMSQQGPQRRIHWNLEPEMPRGGMQRTELPALSASLRPRHQRWWERQLRSHRRHPSRRAPPIPLLC
jgi:hypothetical protein